MFMHSNNHEEAPFTLDMTTSYIGHEGITWGFHGRTGWYHIPGFTLTVMVNNDFDKSYPGLVNC